MLNSEPGGLASVDIRFPDGVQTLSVPHKCLRCEGPVRSAPQAMQCAACGTEWPVQDGVPFYSSAEYFGEVSQAEMKTLIQLASQTNWRTAIRTRFKESNTELYRYAADLNRASWIPLLPIGPNSTVLDIGSGLGALTHALALNYERVVSMEPITERVRFTRIRLEQEGLTNVDLIQTTIDAMPFHDQTFDLIVLNGILEWVAAWRNTGDPRNVQLDVLRKVRRLLKPGGVLLIGIENRIGFESFLGRVDHSGLSFTGLMPRWVASLYLKMRRPGFHRTLLDSSLGYRTYTYSPSGYSRLLREAGFASVDHWWPRDGYNLPHVMYRIADQADIREEALHQCNAVNRINGYAYRRVLKQRVMEKTGLLYSMVPDLVMLARPSTNGSDNHQHDTSMIERLERIVADVRDGRGARPQRCHASVLMGHQLRNKSIIKFRIPSGIAGICKVANVHLPRAEAVEHAYRLLQKLHGLFESAGPPLSGSTPAPVTLVTHGPLIASVEAPAPGVLLNRTSMEANYFADPQRVTRHLEHVAEWLVAAQPILARLQSDFAASAIPFEWRTMPTQSRSQRSALSDRCSWVQHGDFFPTNLLLDEASHRLCVIDWDSCNAGYPPLFDWFCFVTGLYYTHHRVRRLPKGQTIDALSFRQTFFEPSWFADRIVALTLQISTALHLDRDRILDYFADYLAVRHHQFEDDRDSGSKEWWGRLFQEFHAFFAENQTRCIFHPSRI
jgi:SAM-dependent methyltransferase